ncbi:MAG: flippase [Ilumatobacteraceae bacterium]
MNTVGRNLVWLLVAQVATWSMSLVVVLLVPHFLGAEGFGEYAFALAYVGFFQLAGGLGTSIYMTREVARDQTLVPGFVVNGLVLKLVVATLLSLMALGLGLALDFDGQRMTLIAISLAGMYFFLWNEVFSGALFGMQRMGKMSMWSTITVYVSSIAGILVLANNGSVISYTLALNLASLITVVANFVLVLPYVRHHVRLDPAVWKALIVGGVPLMLLLIFNQIYSTLDVPLLAALTSTTVVGWYVLAYRWAAIPIFIANAVMGSHYPEMARLAKHPGPEFAAIVNRAVKLTLVASIPAAVGLAVVAPNLIHVLYEPEFDGSVRPLQVLALQIPITAMDTILATALIASDRLRKYLFVAAAAAVFNPVVCGLLIHMADRVWDNGAIGAALATALTELFVMCCAIYLSSSGVMDRHVVAWSARCSIAGGAIVAVAFIPGDSAFTLALQVVLGAALFGVAAILLRVVSLDMLRAGWQRGMGMVSGRRGRDDQSDGDAAGGEIDGDPAPEVADDGGQGAPARP